MWREPSRNLGLGVSSVCRLQAKCKRAHLQHGTCDSAVGLNVRDGTCAVRLTPPAVAACHATIATDSTATVLRGVVPQVRSGRHAMRSAAVSPSGGSVQHAPLCSAPKRMARHSAQRQSVQRQTSVRRRPQAAADNVQQASCSGQHPARSIRRTTHTEGKQGKTACSGQRAEETMRET